jgi:predicted metalloprotease
MRWEGNRQSGNVIDLRGGAGGATMGCGGVVAVLSLACCVGVLGGDPGDVLSLLDDSEQVKGGGQRTRRDEASDDRMKQFVSTVLADTEDVWDEQLPRQLKMAYKHPELVIFSDRVQSACGRQKSSIGPFYCPADYRVYIDLTFFDEMASQLNAPGEFAQAYVIGHEVGHHLQNLLGTNEEVYRQQQRVSKAEANQLSVRQELQADCYAGAWAHHAQRVRNILEPGDLERALNAASAIGDDRLQSMGGGDVVPESFTHGTSAQRMRWFKVGFDHGDLKRCDTFNAKRL